MIVAILAQDLSMSYSWWSWNKSWWSSSDWTGWQHSQYNNYSNSRWYHNQDQNQARCEPQGELLGWRKRTDKWNRVYYEAKRSRFAELPSGARRTGAIPQTRRFDTMIEDVCDDLPTGVIFIKWPVFTDDYADDPHIARLHDENGTTEKLDNPEQQAQKPILFFMLSSADQGARFKLRSHGKRNSRSVLTIVGPPSVVQCIFQEFYQYTLQQFPDLATRLPMKPPILDHIIDAETYDKDTGAEMNDESSSNSAAGGCAPASSGEHVSETLYEPNDPYDSTD